MNGFDILGIERTNDLKAIKKAYAQKLRSIDLENDPERFQLLKEAYDQALNYAKSDDDSVEEYTHHQKTNLEISLEVPTKELDNEESSFYSQFEAFLSNDDYYFETESWNHFIDSFSQKSLEDFMIMQEELQSFLRQSYVLLSDDVRMTILEKAELNEDYWRGYFEEKFLKEQLLKRNFLDFSFYKKIPSEERSNYFKLRGILYNLVNTQTRTEKFPSAEVSFMEEIDQIVFKDDDFYFLIICSHIWGNREYIKGHYNVIEECMNKIQGTKYKDELIFLKKYLELVRLDQKTSTLRNEQFYLKWFPYELKKKMSTDIYEVKDNSDNVTASIRKPFFKRIKEIFNKKLSAIFLLRLLNISIILVALIIFISGKIKDVSSNNEEEVKTEYYANLKVSGIEEDREYNDHITKEIYTGLLPDKNYNDSGEVHVNSTDEGLRSIEKFKEENKSLREEIKNLDYNFHEVKEKRYLTSNNTLTVVSEIKVKDGVLLESRFNRENKLENVRFLPKEEVIDNNPYGDFDAVMFFLEDLHRDYDSVKVYKEVLKQVGDVYLEENVLNQMLENTTTKKLEKLYSMYYSNLILIQKGVIMAVDDEENATYFVLNSDNKISKIYGIGFELPVPENYLASKIKFDIESNSISNADFPNKWNKRLGVRD